MLKRLWLQWRLDAAKKELALATRHLENLKGDLREIEGRVIPHLRKHVAWRELDAVQLSLDQPPATPREWKLKVVAWVLGGLAYGGFILFYAFRHFSS